MSERKVVVEGGVGNTRYHGTQFGVHPSMAWAFEGGKGRPEFDLWMTQYLTVTVGGKAYPVVVGYREVFPMIPIA